jgi:GT2 family glycosyltransferase
MHGFRNVLRRIRRQYQRCRSWAAGWLAAGLVGRDDAGRGPETTSKPSFPFRLAYGALFSVYFVKRWFQDLLTGRPVVRLSHLTARRREIEANFLIKLVVWRDWPIGRDFNPYPTYAANNRLTARDAGRMRELAGTFEERPFFSILVPVYNARPEWLDRLTTSVLEQTYDRWELVLVDDGSNDPATWSAVVRQTERDDRIVAVRSASNEGVVAATMRGVEASSGDWLAFLDHDDELTPDALWETARAIDADSNADVVYSDEELRNESTGEAYAHFKPGYSPQLLTAYNYICHLLTVRRTAFEAVGGLRPGTDGAQDYDLVLRLSEWTDRFVHVPRVLYRWNVVPESFSRYVDAATGRLRQVDSIDGTTRRIVQEHLDRLGAPARAEIVDHWVRPRFEPADRGKATILVCTKDQPRRLARCVESIERWTQYPNYEILIVDNGSRRGRSRRLLERLGRRCHVVHIENTAEGFNFSRLNNIASAAADGEYLVFLNDDTRVTKGCWLSALIGTLQFPGVGAVGARLLYPDGRNQHAGLIVGAMGWGPWHALMGLPGRTNAYGGYLRFPHNCSAATAACLATRRDLFLEMGGFDERELPVSFNDVDYCLRLVRAGYRIAYAPQAELIHEEGASRGRSARPTEALALKRKWYGYQDPWWNANFNRLTPHFALDPRRRPRDLGVSKKPNVLLIGRRGATWTRRVLEALRERGDCELEFWDFERLDVGRLDERFGAIEDRAVVLDGPEAWPAVDACRRAGREAIWSLPERVMVEADRGWSGRAVVVRVIERLGDPYQVVYSDPFSVGWAAAGLPRPNQWLAARIPLRIEPPDASVRMEMRRDARGWLEIGEERVCLAAVVAADDAATVLFLLRLYRRLKRPEGCFLMIGVEGEFSNGDAQRVYDGVRAAGPGAAVVPAGPEVFAAADVFLAHETTDPRPDSVLEALRHGLPIAATPLVERGDLLHLPETGRSAPPFSIRKWGVAVEELVRNAEGRREMGRQGRAWLETRTSPEDVLKDWRRLLQECSELNADHADRRRADEPAERRVRFGLRDRVPTGGIA